MEKQQVAPSDDWLDLGAKALEVDDSMDDEGGEDQVDGDTDLLESVADDDQAEP